MKRRTATTIGLLATALLVLALALVVSTTAQDDSMMDDEKMDDGMMDDEKMDSKENPGPFIGVVGAVMALLAGVRHVRSRRH